MPIINVEIMKTPDEIEKYDTRCIVMRWGNSEVWSVIKTVKDTDN